MVKDDFAPSEQLSGPLETVEASESHLEFVDCPRENCGETIMLKELESHMSMHEAENSNDEENSQEDPSRSKRTRVDESESESEPKFDTRLPPALRNIGSPDLPTSSPSSDRHVVAKAGWRELLNMTGSRGKSQTSPESRRPHRRLGVCVRTLPLIYRINQSVEIRTRSLRP
jgi:zinc finger-containing ubiquitin peptidase 1